MPPSQTPAHGSSIGMWALIWSLELLVGALVSLMGGRHPAAHRGVRIQHSDGAEGAFPIPAPKVEAASGLNGFDYLISLWFNGLDNMLIRYEGCSKMF